MAFYKLAATTSTASTTTITLFFCSLIIFHPFTVIAMFALQLGMNIPTYYIA